MAYTTLTFYKTVWQGFSNSDTETQKYIDRAADDIDIMTNLSIEVSLLTAKQLEFLQKANCAQAESYIKGSDDYDSLSIGSFSISGNKESNDNLCKEALKYLNAAGLFFSGVKTRCSRYH